MKCALCTSRGEVFETDALGDLLRHYKSDHPGERSPGSKSRTRPAAPGPSASASEPGPGLAPPPAGPGDPDELGDTLERPPTIPAELELETAPSSPSGWRSWRERLGFPPRRSRVPASSSERRPARYKRESTAPLLATIWGGLGYGAIRTGAEPAVGRVMQFQAPVAGEVLEALTADTALDRPLQWAARNTDSAEAAAALFALPALVYAYPRVPPELRPVVEGFMQEAVLAHLKAMGPVLKKKKQREKELERVVAELVAEGVLPPEYGASPQAAVDAILSSVFSGPMPEPEPEPSAKGAGAGEPAGRHEVPL